MKKCIKMQFIITAITYLPTYLITHSFLSSSFSPSVSSSFLSSFLSSFFVPSLLYYYFFIIFLLFFIVCQKVSLKKGKTTWHSWHLLTQRKSQLQMTSCPSSNSLFDKLWKIRERWWKNSNMKEKVQKKKIKKKMKQMVRKKKKGMSE